MTPLTADSLVGGDHPYVRPKSLQRGTMTEYIYLVYAVWWFLIQIIVAGATIVIGLATIRYTVVEQAVRARQFLPTPHHYAPADLFRQGSDGWAITWNPSIGNVTRFDQS